MKATIIPAEQPRQRIPAPRYIDRLAKRLIINRLNRLRYGRLVINTGEELLAFGDVDETFAVSVTLTVHDQRFFSDLAFGGTIGAGEAYMQGFWRCNDLTGLVRIMVRNRELLDSIDSSLSYLAAPAHKLYHMFRRNTLTGSRRNIQAHYDLGNELFKLFLDETLMYSSAIFPHASSSLYEASLTKLARICQKLDLQPTDHVIEIGTGWGGFAIYAAQHYGCRVTTTTISQAQYQHARQRISDAGLEDRIEVIYSDYRELNGQYDKLVSIEMIEAIGHQNYDNYFARCSALLKPDGLMLIQAITIADQHYEAARRSVDFIQRYIFPGSCIPSLSILAASVQRSSDMRLYHLEDIGPHYARTLQLWREQFLDNVAQVRKLGYPNTFIRMWEFYLSYCEGGFIERALGDAQMLFIKPHNRTMAFIPGLQWARPGE
jgi:cyclopropane-fatty-acyl-phospholipid synthase